MKIRETPLAGVNVVQLDSRGDSRGAFTRLFCEEELRDILGGRRIVQANHSITEQVGSIRGMHFQHAPHAEMKLITCVRGAIWDVAVDLRPASPTYLKWHGEELSADGHRLMVIPEGCAHGFQVLRPGSELMYLHTAAYRPSAEGGVRYDDPVLNIRWPLPDGIVSERDRSHPAIDKTFTGVRL